jgi:AcrR family transcriptional regulator
MRATEMPTPAERAMRADARRNDERLLTAASAAFAEQGIDVPLEEIARRAGVGIGTLYRHFPTRQALLEAHLRDHFEALCALAEELRASPSPGDALATWLRALALHATTYRGLSAAMKSSILEEGTELSAVCRAAKAAGAELLERAQEAGVVRRDINGIELLRLVHAIVWATEQSPDGAAQADRLLSLMLDGLRRQEPTTR